MTIGDRVRPMLLARIRWYWTVFDSVDTIQWTVLDGQYRMIFSGWRSMVLDGIQWRTPVGCLH